MKYEEILGRMLQQETVSEYYEEDYSKYFKFHDLLKELFPELFKKCTVEVFKGSLLVKWEGKNPELEPLLFMNHHDVVEPGIGWTHEPFCGEVYDGKLWGRGALDTKGGLFGMLQAAEELIEEGFIPERDIYFESSHSEEVDGGGAELIAQELISRGIHFYMILDEGGMIMYDPIGGADGTFAMVGLGEKSYVNVKFIARSNGGHASTPGKNTPLVRLGKFMAAVDKNNPFEVKLDAVVQEMFSRMAPYMKKPINQIVGRPEKFDIFLRKVLPLLSTTAAAMLRTTIAFTQAQGSDAVNALPTEAWVMGDMRCSHHEGIAKSLIKIRKLAAKYDIVTETPDMGVESSLTDPKCPAFGKISEAVSAAFPGVVTLPYIMTGGSDLRFFDGLSAQKFHFVPFIIDEQQLESIHGIDENVDVACLAPAVEFYKYLYRSNYGK